MEECAKTLSAVVIFQNGTVVICYCNGSASFDQKVIVKARMLHIMYDCSEERSSYVQSAPPLPIQRVGHVEERVQREKNVAGMLEAVISVIVVPARERCLMRKSGVAARGACITLVCE
jgi:hypothetical protein